MENKRRFSVLRFLIGLICVIFIIMSVLVNISFANGKTPNIMGRYLYIVKESDTNGVSDVSEGSALLAMDAENLSIALKDIVLCYPAGDPDNLRLCGIYNIVTSDDGTEKYQTFYDGHEDNTDLITKDKIKAVCTGYSESPELGAFITFTRSIPGVLAELILPCIILVIFFIAGLASSKSDDEEYDFYEYDEDGNKEKEKKKKTEEKSSNPLFEPSQEISSNDELEMKKQSIAENFSQKEVDHESRYQKEKERTMQFKAQYAEKVATGKIANTESIKEEMLRKTAEAERTGSDNLKTTSNAGYNGAHLKQDNDVSTTVPVSNSVRETAEAVVQKKEELPKLSRTNKKEYVPAKSSSPDISDILSKDAAKARKKNAGDMSIDDLLKIIEEEKKKL